MARQRKDKKRRTKEKKEFREVVLKIDRVNRVSKGGRRLRFRATVVIGNEKGLVGLGVGKAEEVVSAIQKGVTKAKRSLQKIQIIDGTIAHQVQAKFKGAEVIMLPARQGTGVIAGGAVRSIAELAGIKNLLSKTHGSNNKINASKATLKAFESLHEARTQEETPADLKPKKEDEKLSPASPKTSPSKRVDSQKKEEEKISATKDKKVKEKKDLTKDSKDN